MIRKRHRSKRTEGPAANKPEEQNPDLMIRAATLTATRAEGEAPPRVSMSVSSEEPVLTFVEFNGTWQRAFEVLDHSPESVDLSRAKDGLVIRDRHFGDQVGLIPDLKLGDRKLGGAVEFCTGPRAQEIAADAAKNLRRNVSIGYAVAAESYRLEGEKDGVPIVRAMSWMPYEASFEPVPADTSVGVGRNATPTKPAQQKGKRTMDTQGKATLDPDGVVEIYRLARAFNMTPGMADDHIKSGKSVEEFRTLALKKAEEDKATAERKAEEERKEREAKGNKPKTPAPGEPLKVLDEREAAEVKKRYSVVNVIRALSGIKVDIGFERELSDELAKRSGKDAQGILIPHEAPAMAPRHRDFVKLANGSNMVATDMAVDLFIDILRSKMVLANAGATVLSGLVGDIAIPKLTGSTTGYWVSAEGGAPTAESNPTIGQVTGTPHTCGGYTDITRRLLIQSSLDAQSLVQNDLIAIVSRLVEVAAFAGTGADGQPTGLNGVSGVNNPTVTQDAATFAQVVSFLEQIETDNAAFEGQSWIMRATVMAHLATRPRFVSTSSPEAAFGPMILDLDNKNMVGYPYQVTNNVPAASLWFGSWANLILALWSGVDITVDPYTNSTTGTLRVVALQDADIMCRYGQAFGYQTGIVS